MPSGQPKALVPQDLQGLRQDQIQILQYLLGSGGAPGAAGSPPAAPQGLNSFRKLVGFLQNPPSQGSGPNAYVGGSANPLDRLQSFFGQLGSPQTALQRQGADAIGTMLGQPTPEQRALDISLPQLQAMLTGQGPQFERDIAGANQQGGRFGSANAVLRGEALRNLFNLRNQTAGTLGLLSQGAGQANRGLAGQAFQTGQAQAGQADIETQRRLQILMQLLGVGQQTAFNVPVQQGQSFLQQLGGLAPLLGLIPGAGPVAAGLGAAGAAFNPSPFGSSGLGNPNPYTGQGR